MNIHDISATTEGRANLSKSNISNLTAGDISMPDLHSNSQVILPSNKTRGIPQIPEYKFNNFSNQNDS